MRARLAIVLPLLGVACFLFVRGTRSGAQAAEAPAKLDRADKGPPGKPAPAAAPEATPAAAAADGAADGAAGAPAADAAGAAEAPAEDLPLTEVTVGIYLNQIHSIDIKNNAYTATFWIWFRWKGDHVKPLESFEIVGGRIEERAGEVTELLEGDVHYAAVRVLATITHFFDVTHFPLDNHTLAIEIEDAGHEDHEVKFVADAANSVADPRVKAPGWIVQKAEVTVDTHTYTTNYGDISLGPNAKSNYSRMSFKLPLERRGLGYYIKLFWGGWLATLVALLAMFIKPTDLDPRFGLGVGALFAAMASAYVVTQSLPDTQVMTLADKINALGIGFIFLSVVESTVSLRLFTSGKEAASQKLDKASVWFFAIGFLVLNAVLVFTR
ncbi:MAG: hypothetical protein IT370_13350 [Deltaproteobacteria bacterium]|nr:hypothetical protein [Deltaproteobacteria bacterium]